MRFPTSFGRSFPASFVGSDERPVRSRRYRLLNSFTLRPISRKWGTVGLLKNPIRVTLNEVKGLLTLVESASRRFFAVLRMTERAFFNSPTVTY